MDTDSAFLRGIITGMLIDGLAALIGGIVLLGWWVATP